MLGDLLLSIPLYKLINNSLALSLLLLCLICLAFSYWKQRQLQAITEQLHLPSLPSPHRAPGLSSHAFPKGLDYLIASICLLIVVLPSIDITADLSTAQNPDDISWGDYATVLIFSALLYIVPIIRWLKLPRASRRHLSIFEPIAWFVITVISLSVLNQIMENTGIIEWLRELTQSPALQESIVLLQSRDINVIIFMTIAAVIIAPIGEEILFRAYLYPLMKPALGKWGAVALSSICFGAVHMALIQTIILSLFGVILCLAYERARSIWLPIFLHACFNGLSVLLISTGIAQ